MIVVAAAGVEENSVITLVTVGGDSGVALLTGVVKRPGQHIGGAVRDVGGVGVGTFHILTDGVESLALRIAGKSGLSLLLGLFQELGLFLVGRIAVSSGVEENVFDVGALIALGVGVISGLHLVVAVLKGIGVLGGIGLSQRGQAHVALEDGLVDQRAAHGLDVLAAGIAGSGGIGVKVTVDLLQVRLHGLAAVKAVFLGLLREQGVGGQAADGLVAEVVVPGAAVGHGAVLILERFGRIQTVHTQIRGVIADEAVVGGVVIVGHISGGVGLVADGNGLGVALDDLGVRHDDDDGDQHKDNGDRDIHDIAAAGLGLLLAFALRAGVGETGGHLLLTGFLFSGCTHLFVQSSQLVGCCLGSFKCLTIITNEIQDCNDKIVKILRIIFRPQAENN